MAGQGLPKIKLWDFSFAVFHSARFDPFLSLASYLDSDLDCSRVLTTMADKLRQVMWSSGVEE